MRSKGGKFDDAKERSPHKHILRDDGWYARRTRWSANARREQLLANLIN